MWRTKAVAVLILKILFDLKPSNKLLKSNEPACLPYFKNPILFVHYNVIVMMYERKSRQGLVKLTEL